jgi:hypothetical protein
VGSDAVFTVRPDAAARAWLASHPATEPRVIAFNVTRCCGGGKLCSVSVRGARTRDAQADYATALLEDGTRLLVDPRAAARLPARFGLTVRGFGAFQHLDLDLEPAQWGALLYD